ncbi:MAG TPA: hypothetical protein PKD70_11240 [Saprospiraceae bacterium]|nr:hypothetical protein [Saprospiraceae bacterium]HMP14446.1 hypothetical protein [Saprospiraceae bacterium]
MVIWYVLPRNYPYLAIALFFVILAKRGSTLSKTVINHERIHFVQQRELLWIPFLLWYAIEYLIRLWQYNDWHEAYLNISFEREAFENEWRMDYRCWHRQPYAWVKYFRKSRAKFGS